jgi:hypothetical protein
MDLTHAIGTMLPATTDDQRAIQRLALRTFNNLGGAVRLVMAGYYQPAVMLIRDVFETAQLVELFSHKPERIAQFRTLSRKERRKRFSPSAVRDELDKMLAQGPSRRADMYSLLSRLAGHPDIDGFVMQQPVGHSDAAWGPFVQAKMLEAAAGEAAKWAAFAGSSFLQMVDNSTAVGRRVSCLFCLALVDWADAHQPFSHEPDLREQFIAVIEGALE